MSIKNMKQNLELILRRLVWYPGHYYSPYPSIKEIKKQGGGNLIVILLQFRELICNTISKWNL